jgi:hypothetical protein
VLKNKPLFLKNNNFFSITTINKNKCILQKSLNLKPNYKKQLKINKKELK